MDYEYFSEGDGQPWRPAGVKMGNNVIDPPNIDQQKNDSPKVDNSIAGVEPSPAVHDLSEGLLFLKEESTFGSLYENLLDVFFPKKLPPLELTSQPIPVVDRMAVKRDPVSTAISTGIHVLLAGIIVFLVLHHFGVVATTPPPKAVVIDADLTPIKLVKSNGGGGGGSHEKTPPSKGAPPPPSKIPITPPTTHIPDQAKLTVPQTMDIPKMPTTMPNIGLATATATLASNGSGGGAGIGTGNGHGIGNGNGEGMGPCSAGNNCFGISGVDKPPVPIYQPQPEFSEEARRAKQQGMVGACMWVNSNGATSHIQIVQPLGFGLDEEAKKSLATWKFKPATKDGKAVTVSDVCVYVNFRMY